VSASVLLYSPQVEGFWNTDNLRLRRVATGAAYAPSFNVANEPPFTPLVVPSGFYDVEAKVGEAWVLATNVFIPDWVYMTLIYQEQMGEGGIHEGFTDGGSIVSLTPYGPHQTLTSEGGGSNSGTGNQNGNATPTQNRKVKLQMQTSGPVSLVEAKTSNDMTAIGEALVAPTVKTGDLLQVAKTAAARAEIDSPACVVLDYRRIGGTVRVSLVERAAANAVAVDAFRDAVLDGFSGSGESTRASYTLEALADGSYKLPGFFTPHDLTAEAPVKTAIMNAGFVAQQDVEFQRAVPSESNPNVNVTAIDTRKKFTPESIIPRAIKLAESDSRFADTLGLVVVVDENLKKVHVLFIGSPSEGQMAFDWRAEAMPAGASAITLDVTVPAEPAPETPAGFNFFA
jgi:hypothetical protein